MRRGQLIFPLLLITLIYSEIKIIAGLNFNATKFQDNFSINIPYDDNSDFSEQINYIPGIHFGLESVSKNGISGLSYTSRGFEYQSSEEYTSQMGGGIYSEIDLKATVSIKTNYLNGYYMFPFQIEEIWSLLGIKQIMNPNSINNTHFLFGVEVGYFLSGKMDLKISSDARMYNEFGQNLNQIQQKISDSMELDREDWQDQNGDIFDAGLSFGLSYNINTEISTRIIYYYGLVEPRKDELSNWSTINISLGYSI